MFGLIWVFLKLEMFGVKKFNTVLKIIAPSGTSMPEENFTFDLVHLEQIWKPAFK